jgi:glycosyltransferase involved in cell wall biosynthesis
VALRALRTRLRRIDREAAQAPRAYFAISTAVQQRIRRFYDRDAVVVHPPVDVDEFDPTREKEPGQFLWVHRLVSYKRPEVVVEAFRGTPYRLTMVGVGPLERAVRRVLPDNVELRAWVGRDELRRLYATASGFIHVGEEDFGISMVEALAAGTPVIALDAGGARDIVRHEVDGVLIERAEPDLLRSALGRLSERRWSRDVLAARAAEFSRARFVGRLRSALAELAA